MKSTLFLSIVIMLSQAIGYAQHLPELIPYSDGDKWGYCDGKGKVKIKPQWDKVGFFCRDKAVVTMFEDSTKRFKPYYCLIDKKGNYIIPPSMHWNRKWDGWETTPLNAHNNAGKYGLIDTNNNVIIPFTYDYPGYRSYSASEKYKIVSRGGKRGLIDVKNTTMLPFDYDDIKQFSPDTSADPVFKVQLNKLWGLVEINNRQILPAEYLDIYPPYGNKDLKIYIRKGLILTKMVNGVQRQGWIDLPTNKLIEPIYHQFDFISDKFYVADGKLYDTNNNQVLSSYQNFYRRHDTLFSRTNGKYSLDSSIYTQYAFDINTLGLINKQEIAVHIDLSDWPGHSGNKCGFGMAMAAEFEAQHRLYEAQRPILTIDGKYTKDFKRDSIEWHTRFFIGQHYWSGNDSWDPVGTYALAGDRIEVSGSKNNNVVYNCVVNKNGTFIFPPIPGGSQISGVNLKDSLVILNNNNYYGVSNLAGTVLVPMQEKIICGAFYTPDKKLILGLMGNHKNFAKICDSSLHPIPALDPYYFRELVGEDFVCRNDSSNLIKVADSNGMIGYITINGNTVLKHISFRYKRCTAYSNDVFAVNNTNTALPRDIMLINSSNKELMPGTVINSVKEVRTESPSPAELFQATDSEVSGLLLVNYISPTNHVYRDVYLSSTGHIYTRKL